MSATGTHSGISGPGTVAHSPNDLENEAVRNSQPVLNMVASVPNLTFHVKFHDLGLYSPNRSDYIIQRFNLSQADLIYAYFAPFFVGEITPCVLGPHSH